MTILSREYQRSTNAQDANHLYNIGTLFLNVIRKKTSQLPNTWSTPDALSHYDNETQVGQGPNEITPTKTNPSLKYNHSDNRQT